MIALLDVQRLLARLRFRHLQLLDALAEHGSMRRAAIALHLTQPALSKALHELEDILGLVLYERSPSGLVCTRAGQVLVRGARLLIEDIKQITRRRRVPWTELADRAWVLLPEPSFVRRAVAERFAASGLHPATPAVESASVSTNVALAAAGIGLGAVPRVVMLEAGRLGKLRRVRVDPPPVMPAVRLVHFARASLRHTFALVRQTIVQVLPAAGYASPE